MGPKRLEPGQVLVASRVVLQQPKALELLKAAELHLIPNPAGGGLAGEDLLRLAANADALIVGPQPVTTSLLDQAPRLRIIAKAAVGIDNIDVAAATARRIPVFSAVGANAEAVADYTFGLLLALARRIPAADRSVREGRWEKFMGMGVRGRTLGIVGLGNIGRAVARRAAGFEMTVLAHTRTPDPALAKRFGLSLVPLEELLARSDFVTLHLPLTPESRRLIRADSLRLMKPSACLVNTARGGLVDHGDLLAALQSGRLAGAALDVFDPEPPLPGPLFELDNVILSPHTAAHTPEAQEIAGLRAAAAVADILAGRVPAGIVNPEALASSSLECNLNVTLKDNWIGLEVDTGD